MLSSISRVDSDFVGSKAYAILQALFKKNNIKSNKYKRYKSEYFDFEMKSQHIRKNVKAETSQNLDI